MKLFLALFVGFLLLSGCSERVIPPVDGPQSVEFGLVYPQPPTSNALFGVSGVRLVTDEILRDTVVRVTGRSFFGQFYSGGATMPTQVELNGAPFVKHANTDTLRLGATSNSSLYGIHTWRLTDPSGPLTYQVQLLAEIDSVTPLMYYDEPIRGDTALTLGWRAPGTASGGVLITWRQPGIETYSQIVADIGRFTIPANIVARFSGDSELILSRFRNETVTHREQQLILTRVAQRNYKVTILG